MNPRIICHMMSSVDGRLLPERYSQPFDGKNRDEVVGAYFEISYKLESEGVIMGRNSLQKYFTPAQFDSKEYAATKNPATFIANRTAAASIVILDALGKTSYDNKNGVEDNIIAVLSESVSDEYLQHLRDNNDSYLFAGANGDNLSMAMDILGSKLEICC